MPPTPDDRARVLKAKLAAMELSVVHGELK